MKLTPKELDNLALSCIHHILAKEPSDRAKKEGMIVAGHALTIQTAWMEYRRELTKINTSGANILDQLDPKFRANLSREQLFHIKNNADKHLIRINSQYRKVDEALELLAKMFEALSEELQEECFNEVEK